MLLHIFDGIVFFQDKIKTESMNWGIIEYFHPNGRRIKFHAE